MITSFRLLYYRRPQNMHNILFTLPITDQQKADITAQCSNAHITFMPRKDVTLEVLKEHDAVIGNVSPELIGQCDIKWMHLESAGVERYLHLPDTITLTNSTGAYGQAIGEHILGCIFYFYKKLNLYVKQQPLHLWKNQGKVDSIAESVTVVVGLGDIGYSVAKQLKALGSTVYGVKRRINEPMEGIEKLYTFDDMDEILPQADIVILALPATAATYHVFDETRLRSLKKSCVLVNVGRGNAIDTMALMRVLDDRHFKGVALDVCEVEPLPLNHKLWNYENVLITPHVSGNYNMEYTYTQVVRIAVENLVHYVNDEPLDNIIDRSSGYTR